MENLKKTPLFEEHQKLGAKMVPFGGWMMPIQYFGIIDEHHHCREKASLFDTCHMGEFYIKADLKNSSLENLFSFRLADIAPKRCRYGCMLNESGGVIDDLIVFRISNDEWLIVVNGATQKKDYDHIKKNLIGHIVFEDQSEKTAKIDIQGPLSSDVINDILGCNVAKLKYFSFDNFSIFSQESIISRTGYTGELGYEIYINRAKAAELWNALLADDRCKPAGLGARDTLRLEMGYSLYGHELDDEITPFEAGLEYFVHQDKSFIGKEAALSKKTKKKIAFKTNSRRSPRSDYSIFIDEKEVGIVSSGSFSPSLGHGIGLGFINTDTNSHNRKMTIGNDRITIDIMESKLPFYTQGSYGKKM